MTLIVNSFNSLRTDICSSQVIEVTILDAAQTKQSSGSNLILEVVTMSERALNAGAFSMDGITEDAFLSNLNSQLTATGSTSMADSMDFLGPSVRCSANRASYSVTLNIEYESDSALACQGKQNETKRVSVVQAD